jgi:hypothetical protein
MEIRSSMSGCPSQKRRVEIETASRGLKGSGQHCYAGKHDFGSFHLEARTFEGALGVFRRQAHGTRVVQHASKKIPGGKGRLLGAHALPAVISATVSREELQNFTQSRHGRPCLRQDLVSLTLLG